MIAMGRRIKGDPQFPISPVTIRLNYEFRCLTIGGPRLFLGLTHRAEISWRSAQTSKVTD
jgi:hypothetical protein